MDSFAEQLAIGLVAGGFALGGVALASATTAVLESQRRRWERRQHRNQDLRALYGTVLHAGRDFAAAIEDLGVACRESGEPSAELLAECDRVRRRHGALVQEVAIVGGNPVIESALAVHRCLCSALTRPASRTRPTDFERLNLVLIKSMRVELNGDKT